MMIHKDMCQANAVVGDTAITLMKYGDLDVINKSVVLTDDRANPAHLFCVGQKIKVEGHPNDSITVKGVVITNNRVVLTVDALTFALNKNDFVSIDFEITEGDVVISNVALNIGTVDPPQDYLNEIMKLTNTGKLQFDITSYTLFNKNISKDSLSNSLVINAMNRRAKSLICIPIMSKHDVLVDTFQCLVDANNQLQSYSLKLYNNVIVPDRLVPLTSYNDGKFNAICQREQMLSADSAGWEVNNIKDMHQHFFLGRRLAMKGYSYDCKGQIELNVNYKQNSDAFVMGCFVYHKRNINVNDNNVSVVF